MRDNGPIMILPSTRGSGLAAIAMAAMSAAAPYVGAFNTGLAAAFPPRVHRPRYGQKPRKHPNYRYKGSNAAKASMRLVRKRAKASARSARRRKLAMSHVHTAIASGVIRGGRS